MKALLFCSMCVSMLLVQGCASIFCGDSRTVEIKSEPADAKFIIRDRHGIAVHTGTTPATVSLKRGGGYFKAADYTIQMEKPGYEKSLTDIKSDIEWGWYLGGNALVFGGLLGLVVVDPITGGMYKIQDVNVALDLASADSSGKEISGYIQSSQDGVTYRTPLYEDGTKGEPRRVTYD